MRSGINSMKASSAPLVSGGAWFDFTNMGSLTIVSTVNWDVKPERFVTEPGGWLENDNDMETVSIANDPTAPVSPSNVLAKDFLGIPRGSGGFNTYRPFANPSERKNTLYYRAVLKLSNTWENNLIVGCKNFWPACDQVQGAPTYNGWHGPDLMWTVNQQAPHPEFGDVDRQMDPNLGNEDVAKWINYRGIWRLVEVKLKLQSTLAAADGEAHVWHDGQKTHQYTDVHFNFSDLSTELTWKSLSFNPTYGGDMTGLMTPLETSMILSCDHIIIAVGNT